MTQATPISTTPSANPPPTLAARTRAPFLLWPVGQREFYTAIAVALLLPLGWGVMIFGWRALVLLIATVAGAMLTHVLLQRFTTRGSRLVTAHSLVSAMLLAALAQGLWSPVLFALGGALVVLVIWAFGGPGHERVHAWLLVLLVLTLFILPAANPAVALREGVEPVLARDRLFMGDLRASYPRQVHYWPGSAEIRGHDAVQIARPDYVVAHLLAEVTQVVQEGRERRRAAQEQTQRQDAALTSQMKDAPPTALPELQRQVLLLHEIDARREDQIRRETRERATARVDAAFVSQLPSMELMLLGVMPGRIGAVGGLGIVIGGLFLAYRNILRPRSWALFLMAVLTGLVIATLQAGVPRYFDGLDWSQWLGQLFVLLLYELFSRDILFASVFILAMPGSEPITPRGRRIYLLFAGVLAGYVYRENLPVPPATLVLFSFQLVAPLFDMLLARRSWMMP